MAGSNKTLTLEKKKIENVLGNCFFEDPVKVPTPVFQEITKEELSVDEEEKINRNITNWSKYLSELSSIRQSFIKDFLDDEIISVDNYGKGANKHKINVYELFKDIYAKDLKVKSDANAAGIIFTIKSYVAASMKRIKYIVYVHLSQKLVRFYMENLAAKLMLVDVVATVLCQFCEYKNLALKIVPDDKTCTEIFQT